ncbi:MAG: hypothetical protein IPI67_18265 [Myxococcales bacterium]|nr:hypothetical protein [Myxococcales bacterium]
MWTRTAFLGLYFVMVTACGGSAPPAQPPDADPREGISDVPPAPKGEVPAEETAEAANGSGAEAAEAKPVEKPKSAAAIGGSSLSDVSGVAVQAEAKKLGWFRQDAAVGGGTMGVYEQFRFEIEKGKLKGFIELVRPAAKPTPAGSGGMVPPAELKDMREKEGAAVHFDEASDVVVIVSVEGKPADAKKLLGKLIKLANASAKKAEKTAKKGKTQGPTEIEAPPEVAPKKQ